jgi:hypothetical protein
MFSRFQLRSSLIGLLLLVTAFTGSLFAQPWEFVKEQDAIKVYTRQEAGKPLKAYRGTASIKAPAEKVFALIEDVNHTEWWDKDLSEIKVLAYEKNKMARYYLVYDSPWPVSDRDLCTDITVTIDPVKKIYTAIAVPLTGVIPEREDRVRIKDYRQTWIVSPAGQNVSNVVVEGYADPIGNIPDWLSNMLITKTPINAILGVRNAIEKK